MQMNAAEAWNEFYDAIKTRETNERLFDTIVAVTWIDSCQVTHGWQLTSEIHDRPLTPCFSVGYLLHMTPEYVGIVQSISTTDDEDHDPQAMGYMKIPRCSVINIDVLQSK